MGDFLPITLPNLHYHLPTFFSIRQYEKEFSEVIQAMKGSANEKKLAARIISQFCQHFAKFFKEAIDAMIELCSDNDVAVS